MMQTIRETVQGVIKDLKQRRSDNQQSLFRLFKRNLTRQERLHIKCVSLRGGIITVNVDSSAWLYQLSQKKDALVGKLEIKDIRLRIGDIN